MKHFKKMILFSILLIILIPICSANENITLNDESTILGEGNSEISNSKIYFDSSAAIDGNGSKNSPYNHLESSRLSENSVAYFANGNYYLDSGKTLNNLTIIGQNSLNTIINGHSSQLSSANTLSISSITLNDLTIRNNKNFTANGVIFENNQGSYKGGYSNVYGGAIHSRVCPLMNKCVSMWAKMLE